MIGSADIEQAILKYLATHRPIPHAEYTCDLSGVSLPAIACDSVAVDGFDRPNPSGQTTVRLSFYRLGKRMQSSAINARIGIRNSRMVSTAPITASAAAADDHGDIYVGIPQDYVRPGGLVDFILALENIEAAADVTQVVIDKTAEIEIVDDHISISVVWDPEIHR